MLMNTRIRPATAEGFNPSINGFRGVCALFVFGFHIFNAGIVQWSPTTTAGEWAVFLAAATRFGVEMFFMISGFVIVGSLLRHASLQRFYRDRFVRIYSLWLPLLAAICVLGPIAGWRVFAGGYDGRWILLTLGNLFLLPPLFPFPPAHPASWSLSYEWLFYFGAGLVWWVGMRGEKVQAATLAVGLFAVAVFAMPRSLFFATGVLVFLFRHKLESWQRWLRFPTLSLLAFLLAWGATDVSSASPFHDVQAWLRFSQWVFSAIAFLASLHCFACLVHRQAFASRILEQPLFQFLGNISFSFYLVSGMVMFAVKKLCLTYFATSWSPEQILWAFGTASLVLSVLLSWGTRTLFEQKLARLMRTRLGRGAEPQRLPNDAAPQDFDVAPVAASGRNSG